MRSCFFFFNDTATTEIYTLSLHDALPISERFQEWEAPTAWSAPYDIALDRNGEAWTGSMLSGRILRSLSIERSEEPTSEIQSLAYLVCRLLLGKKKRVWSRNLCSRPLARS